MAVGVPSAFDAGIGVPRVERSTVTDSGFAEFIPSLPNLRFYSAWFKARSANPFHVWFEDPNDVGNLPKFVEVGVDNDPISAISFNMSKIWIRALSGADSDYTIVLAEVPQYDKS